MFAEICFEALVSRRVVSMCFVSRVFVLVVRFWFYIKSRQEQKQEDPNDGDADEGDVKQGKGYNDALMVLRNSFWCSNWSPTDDVSLYFQLFDCFAMQVVTMKRMKQANSLMIKVLLTARLMQCFVTSATLSSVSSWNPNETWRQGWFNICFFCKSIAMFFGSMCLLSIRMVFICLGNPENSHKVRPLLVVFDQSSVYGVREGYHSALLVTCNDKTNFAWKSSIWRHGVVSPVTMLPRRGLKLICVFGMWFPQSLLSFMDIVDFVFPQSLLILS